jgi:CDP-diacylglycerol---serine O-phosphatidyltransferase
VADKDGQAKASASAATSEKQTERRRGIYLLPNLLTTCAIFAGYYAIVASINGRWVDACMAVFIAAFFDGIDGRVARLTNSQSEFGVQYDSLSDLVSFGLAPSLIMYNWSLVHLKELGPIFGKLGWLAAFLYAACAALRLARFNVQVGVADKRFFQGLASPAAAATMVSLIWAVEKWGGDGKAVRWLTPFVTASVALLMVSNLRYYSFKAWPEKVPFIWAIAIVLVFVAIALHPPAALLSIVWVYIASGPILTLMGIYSKAKKPALESALPASEPTPIANAIDDDSQDHDR